MLLWHWNTCLSARNTASPTYVRSHLATGLHVISILDILSQSHIHRRRTVKSSMHAISSYVAQYIPASGNTTIKHSLKSNGARLVSCNEIALYMRVAANSGIW